MERVNCQNKLSIVIPAYKDEFLFKTLESIANQTCKKFVLYIGDDASPYNLKNIVDQYMDRINIVYKRFDDNLGGKDLVAHWNRCLNLINGEEWVWFFSDDDLMEASCVSKFYETINREGIDTDIFHFNINIIDENNKLIRETVSYDERLNVEDFFVKLYTGKISARMPEFIFKYKSLIKNNGFVNYDLAWRSDNATVIKIGYKKGIYTINGNQCRVLWRLSKNNISGDKALMDRKNTSTIRFFNDMITFFSQNEVKMNISDTRLIWCYIYNLIFDCKANIIYIINTVNKFIFINNIYRKVIALLIVFYRLLSKKK